MTKLLKLYEMLRAPTPLVRRCADLLFIVSGLIVLLLLTFARNARWLESAAGVTLLVVDVVVLLSAMAVSLNAHRPPRTEKR